MHASTLSFLPPAARRSAARLGLAGLSLLLLSLPAPATEVTNQIKRSQPTSPTPASETLTKDGELQPVLSRLSPQEASRLLQEAGFKAPELASDGDLIVEMQGFKVVLMVGSNQGEWLLLKFAVTGSNLDFAALNAWNRQAKYSRAYIDEAGVVILESDQDLSGGVTPKRLKEFMRSFDESLRIFSKQLVDEPDPRG